MRSNERIVGLLNERAGVVVKVGEVKRAGGEDVPIYAPDREQAVLEKVRKLNHGPLPDRCLEAVWRELMSGSFALERPLRIGYLGPAGSFSHLAAVSKFGRSVEYDELSDFTAIFDAVARGHADYGLIPIENSTHGGVTASLDCFLESGVPVCAEILVPIHHNLLSRVPLERVKTVYSHPQALGQCQRWLTAQLPHAKRLDAASTSHAARLVAEQPAAAAAIGSTLASQLYGLPVLFDNIEDNPNNTTRFSIIGRQSPRHRRRQDRGGLHDRAPGRRPHRRAQRLPRPRPELDAARRAAQPADELGVLLLRRPARSRGGSSGEGGARRGERALSAVEGVGELSTGVKSGGGRARLPRV